MLGGVTQASSCSSLSRWDEHRSRLADLCPSLLGALSSLPGSVQRLMLWCGGTELPPWGALGAER